MLARARIPTRVSLYSRHASSLNRPNREIIEMLKQNLANENMLPAQSRNTFKMRAFQSAIKTIDLMEEPIRSGDDARKHRGIGEGIATRIDEFLKTTDISWQPPEPEDRPRRRKRSPNKPKPDGTPIPGKDLVLEDTEHNYAALAALQEVPGIGTFKARMLVAAGCNSPEELRNRPDLVAGLQAAARVGLEYYDRIVPVPRKKCEEALDIVRSRVPPDFDVQLVGSYRRGAGLGKSQTPGDIDLVLFDPALPPPVGPSNMDRGAKAYNGPAGHKPMDHLRPVVEALEAAGVIVATLRWGPCKWQGVIRLEPESKQVYRMDLNLHPKECEGAALLALTGDTDFNRHLRLRAMKIGAHLNEWGLWRKKGEEEDAEWERAPTETEEDVFAELGQDYVPPVRRNFAFLVATSPKKKTGRRPKNTV